MEDLLADLSFDDPVVFTRGGWDVPTLCMIVTLEMTVCLTIGAPEVVLDVQLFGHRTRFLPALDIRAGM